MVDAPREKSAVETTTDSDYTADSYAEQGVGIKDGSC